MLESMPNRIAQDIEALIGNSGLQPGDRLPGEREFCKTLNIGRPLLREAIRVLEQKRIVEVKPAKGCFIRENDAQEAAREFSERLKKEGFTFDELLESRTHLESRIAELAASRRTHADLEALSDNMRELEANVEDPDKFLELDFQFHLRLSQATRNRFYPLWLQPIMDNLMVTRRGLITLRPVRRRVIACHQVIYRAVANGDSDAARTAVESHIEQFVNDTRYAGDLGIL